MGFPISVNSQFQATVSNKINEEKQFPRRIVGSSQTSPLKNQAPIMSGN